MSATASAPFEYNLLELYRQHRDEIDVLTDQTSLFILAFTNTLKSTDVDSLAGDVNLSPNALRAKLAPLLRGQMMLDAKGVLTVTALGRRVLAELGFIPPVPPGPTEPPKKPEPPQQPSRPKLVRREVPRIAKPSVQPAVTPGWLWGVIAFLATALVVIVGTVAVILLWPQPPPPPPTAAPQIQIDFNADRTDLIAGDCTTLRWQVHGADWVELNGARVEPIDQMRVCPESSTTYSLVTGGGVGVHREITINVASPPLPDTPRPPTLPPFTPFPIPTNTPTPTATRTPTPVILLDFVRDASKATWESDWGVFAFGGSPTDQRGAAYWSTNAAMEDGSNATLALATHPQWATNGYIRGSYPQTVKIQQGDRLRIRVGFLQDPNAMGDVTFTVNYHIPGVEFSDKKVTVSHTYTKQLVERSFDLSSSAGSTLEFQLRVDAGPLSGKYFPAWVAARIERP